MVPHAHVSSISNIDIAIVIVAPLARGDLCLEPEVGVDQSIRPLFIQP